MANLIIPSNKMEGVFILIHPKINTLNAKTLIVAEKSNYLMSQVIITGVGKLNIPASIDVKEYNMLNAQVFNVMYRKKYLQGVIRIKGTTRIQGIYNIRYAPRVQEKLVPTKDLFVLNTAEVINYGMSNELVVGNNEGSIYRSFMKFSIDSIPKEPASIINKALLTLTIKNISVETFTGLKISTLKYDFNEYGATWRGQPLSNRIFDIINVSDTETTIVLDVLDLVKEWYSGTYDDIGFTLTAVDESIQQLIRIYSRENMYSPTLDIQYFSSYIPTYEKKKLLSEVLVVQQEKKTLPAKINLITIPGNETLNAKAVVTIGDNLYSTVNVIKESLDAKVNITGNVILNSKALIVTKAGSSIDGTIRISQPYMKAKMLSVEEVTETFPASTFIVIYEFDKGRLNCKVFVPRTSKINGKAVVKESSTLNSTVFITQGEYTPLNAKVFVPITNALPAKIRPIDIETVTSQVLITQKERSSLSAKIFLRRTKRLIAKVRIRKWSSLNAKTYIAIGEKSTLSSKVFIPRKNTLRSKLRVKLYDTLNTTANVVGTTNTLNAHIFLPISKPMPAKVRIGKQEFLNSQVLITQGEVSNLNSKVFIPRTSKMDSIVRAVEREELPSEVLVTVRETNTDLKGKLVIPVTSHLSSTAYIVGFWLSYIDGKVNVTDTEDGETFVSIFII